MNKKKFLKEFLSNFVSIVRFNFHYLPFKQAIRFPIFLKDANLRVLKGTVTIDSANIHPGMIRLGFSNTCMITHKGFHWLNRGGVIFLGQFSVGNDSVMETSSEGILTIGDNVSFNGGLHLSCCKSINIGSDVLGSWDVNIYDTDFHRMTNASTNMLINSCSSSITIGKGCWLCFGATLLKGSVLGDYCTVGAKSLVTKNFGKEKYTIVAGHPAHVVKRGIYLNKKDCSPEWHY